jgi:Lysozyme like domain
MAAPYVMAAPAAGAPSAPPVTFIEALAAVPAATRALATARAELGQAVVRRATIEAAAAEARAELDAVTAIARETHLAAVRADAAAAQTQSTIDGIARTMYMSGGALPTLVDVMLTADSEVGLTRSLVTRQYLAAAGDRFVHWDELAEEARDQATRRHESATALVDTARTAVSLAAAAADAADADVDDAQAVVDEARTTYRTLMRMTTVDRSDDYGRISRCGDWLTRLLSRSGYEGEDLREAWAIVMRESGGRADAVSETGDLGLFQINTATWKDEDWFDRKQLLTRRYNSQIAHQLSRGGRSWYSWGLDGHGRPDAGAYVKSGWSDERIDAHIVVPYIQWYAQYPCRPAYERDVGLPVPELPFDSYGQQAGEAATLTTS